MSSRRDYKSATTGQRRQRARRNGLLVVTLMLIGLFGGLLAYIRGDRPQPPTTAAVAPSAPAQPAAAPVAAPPSKAVVVAPPAAEPEPARPKYDFYTELPKRQIDIHPEVAKPKNAPQPVPAQMQPAVNQLHKPSAPRGNAKAPTPAVAKASSPDSKAANTKITGSKSMSAKPATSESANSKSTSAQSKAAAAKSATSESANSKSTSGSKAAAAKSAASESANSKSTATGSRATPAKSTNVTPALATPPARMTQPSPPLINNRSKIVVKTE